MDDSIRDSERLNVERHEHRHRNIRKTLYCATLEGVEVTAEVFLEPLTKFLAGKDPDNLPPLPPEELNWRLGCIPDAIPHVALAILQPVLDAIARGWEVPKKTAKRADNWRMLLAKQMGEILGNWLALKDMEAIADYEAIIKKAKQDGREPPPPPAAWLKLKEMECPDAAGNKPLIPRIRRGRKSTYKFLHDDWTASECVVAGDWMLDVVERLPCFGKDGRGRICIAPEWQDRVDAICDDLLRKHPVRLPHRDAPRPATGWWTTYSDRLRAPFVRDWRPETRKNIEATFETAKPPVTPSGPFAELADARLWMPFPHADGVNALKVVPLRVNQALLPLVGKFAVELMDHDGDKRKADRKTVKADLRDANWCGNGTVYLDYGCDKRGRVYSEQHLNYAREDHVRALFEFERGEPLGDDGMFWLEVHTANCEGSTDKEPWDDRRRWTKKNKDRIDRVASDPQNNYDDWRDADKPFAFVAACRELSRARKDPAGFITHLPIPFDGACNGIQHLAMLSRDEKAAELVNLMDTDRPRDIYLMVTWDIIKLLEDENPRLINKDKDNAWCFPWWRKRLRELTERQKRKLFKTPTMTFPYASTVFGMADKIVETYAELFPDRTWPTDAAAMFLARAVRLACQDRLKGPVRIMKYVRALALYRYKQGKFLEWRSPTGFPCANMYNEPNIVHIDLPYGGVRSRYTVADGAKPEMKRDKMLNAASPNFIHSLDAAHLMRTVLAANSEGIRDIIPVHDSYSCLAPHVVRFGKIIRREFAMLYTAGDPLRALRDANVDDPNLFPLPKRGNYNPLDVENAEYAFM
jgi:hypothetical protein